MTLYAILLIIDGKPYMSRHVFTTRENAETGKATGDAYMSENVTTHIVEFYDPRPLGYPQ